MNKDETETKTTTHSDDPPKKRKLLWPFAGIIVFSVVIALFAVASSSGMVGSVFGFADEAMTGYNGDNSYIADTSSPSMISSANAAESAVGSTDPNLNERVKNLLGLGSVLPSVKAAQEPRPFLGNENLFSSEFIRKNADRLKDGVTVSLRALETAGYGLISLMEKTYKDAFDLKFFQDVHEKLIAIDTSWLDAMKKRWTQGVSISDSYQDLEKKIADLQAGLGDVKAEVEAIWKRLNGGLLALQQVGAAQQLPPHHGHHQRRGPVCHPHPALRPTGG